MKDIDLLVNPPIIGVPESRLIETRTTERILADNARAFKLDINAPTDKTLEEYYRAIAESNQESPSNTGLADGERV